MIDSNFNFHLQLQKIYLILGLLVTAACAEKKINLEDIERDNLRAENIAKTENIRTDETKYVVKPNIYQQQYQISSQYNGLNAHSEPYVPVQQLQNIKYSQVPPEAYVQHNQYAVHEVQYKQPNQILPQQNLPPLQYYSGYQQQAEIPTKSVVPIAFESQRLNYHPEVVVGNHIQSVQQKAVTEKYAKPINKEPVYVDIPMTQLLSYYPHLDINSLKTVGLAQSPAQQISVPVYTPVYSQKQLIPPVKTPYPSVVPTPFTTKVTKGLSQTLPLPSKKLASAPPVLPTPLYIQPQPQPQPQSVTQGKTLLHTQAYIVPMQPQYVQQLVYTQPGIVYSDPTAAYSNLYTRIPAYIQDNSLHGQSNQYQEQSVAVNQYQTQQQIYVTPTIGQEAPKEVLQEQIGQDFPQTYVKQVAEEPKSYFVPPQLPAENFKSAVTQLEPVPSEDEQPLPLQDHSLPSAPRSLLDSYIPSKIIAAQDSARYRERPIKLEGGFLPSKVNFALKKRRSE
ncbi:uncharacterized protein LOC105277601 [Ooceraea biroi]|uniref:uncharacterized protein LOC105277601 n=1 Tax=Ooceraea biroi TaxID=2015173 RepID=UPI0005BDF50E|nr:uncharacterized protein LOC105277601 [Ooceraea biroi]